MMNTFEQHICSAFCCWSWVVAKDVAEALGYAIPSKAINTHCKAPEILKASEMEGLPSRGLQIIPELDLCRLL